MTDRIAYFVPRDDFQIGDPDLGGHLAPEGRVVTVTPYWHRRLLDGDVIEKPMLAPVPAASPKSEVKK